MGTMNRNEHVGNLFLPFKTNSWVICATVSVFTTMDTRAFICCS